MAITSDDLIKLIRDNRQGPSRNRQRNRQFMSAQEVAREDFEEFAKRRPRDIRGRPGNVELNRNIVLRRLADRGLEANIDATRAATEQTRTKTGLLQPEFDLKSLLSESLANQRNTQTAIDRAKFESTQDLLPLSQLTDVLGALPIDPVTGDIAASAKPIADLIHTRIQRAISQPQEEVGTIREERGEGGRRTFTNVGTPKKPAPEREPFVGPPAPEPGGATPPPGIRPGATAEEEKAAAETSMPFFGEGFGGNVGFRDITDFVTKSDDPLSRLFRFIFRQQQQEPRR